MGKWEKRLTYLVVTLVLIGLYNIKTTPKLNWNELKYKRSYEYNCTRDELKQLLQRRLDDRDLIKEKAGLPTKELREYVYNLGKNAYPMEALGGEAEKNSELQSIRKIGRLGIIVILFIAMFRILEWIGLIRVSFGVKPPEKG